MSAWRSFASEFVSADTTLASDSSRNAPHSSRGGSTTVLPRPPPPGGTSLGGSGDLDPSNTRFEEFYPASLVLGAGGGLFSSERGVAGGSSKTAGANDNEGGKEGANGKVASGAGGAPSAWHPALAERSRKTKIRIKPVVEEDRRRSGGGEPCRWWRRSVRGSVVCDGGGS